MTETPTGPEQHEIRLADVTERNIVSAGQRAINKVWEYTQSAIAISVTLLTLLSAATLIWRNAEKIDAGIQLLSNGFFLVLGFYFGRTNHQRMGGVGPNEGGR